jgi:cell division protein FtsI/penicillin-binding protein 2
MSSRKKIIISDEKALIVQRFGIIELFFAAFFMLSTLGLLYFSVHKRAFYLTACSKIAWEIKTIPAARGAILDKNGTALAWTERYYDLQFPKTTNPISRNKIISEIQSVLNCKIEKDKDIIKTNLTLSEIKKLEKIIRNSRGTLKIKTRFERQTVDYPEIKKILGTIPQKKNTEEEEVSLEFKYDKDLRGQDGIFKVMLDKNRQSLLGALEWIQKHKKGKNIRLEFSLQELIKNNGEKNNP